MSYVPRPLSEIARMQPGPMDWDAMHDLGPQEIARDHYMLGTLRSPIRVQCTNLSASDFAAATGETSSPAQVVVLASGLGPAVDERHASYDAVEEAVQAIVQQFHQLPEGGDVDLASIFAAAQQRVRRLPRYRPRDVFGCSLAAAVVRWPQLQLAHAGDIRCFLYSRSRLHLLTSVHTLGARLSQPDGRDAWALPTWGDVLWNAITATGRDVEPELVDTRLAYGDALVLCTAPVAHAVSPRRIATLLREDRTAGETCRQLLELAKSAGCRAESSVAVVRFRSPERWQHMQSERPSRTSSPRTSPPLGTNGGGDGASGRNPPGFNKP